MTAPPIDTADADTDTDTDTDTDADTDTDTDTDADTDTDTYVGACAPPDDWTGPVPPALYTSDPYDASYDAGLTTLVPYLPTSNSSSSGGESVLVYDATVTAVGNGDGATRDHVYVADGSYTVVINDGYEGATAEIGDRVGFSTSLFATVNGERTVDRTSGWTILSSDNPVYVRELGAATIDYEARLSEVTHLYGEVTRKSSYDCGSGYACFIVDHGGTENLVRVKATNSFGLGADYDGGLCAEVVAPVSMYTGSKGNAEFLDVMDSDWMRTWAAE